jgi:hypothetical protein
MSEATFCAIKQMTQYINAYNVGMNRRQYIIRGVSSSLDKELRMMARRSGRSLNAVTLDVLKVGVGIPDWFEPNHDLDDLFGKLDKDEARRLDKAVKELRTIDEQDWK